MPWQRASLAVKLNLALFAFFIALGAATLGIVLYGFQRTQDNAQERSEAALQDQGELALQAVVGGASEQGGLLFELAAETGRRSAQYLDSPGSAEARGGYEQPSLAMSPSGVRYDPNPNRTSDLVVLNGASPDDTAVLDDIAFSAALDTIFPVLLESFAGEVGGQNFDPIAIVFISTNSASRYYPPIGIHQFLPGTVDIAQRMAAIGPAANPDRRTVWTAPYTDAAGQGQLVTARSPVYDGNRFRGSLEVDLSLTRLIDEVNEIRVTPRSFALYVDTAGDLLHTNAYELLSREAETNAEAATILDSMRHLDGSEDVTVRQLTLDGEGYFIAYAPMPSLGGSFAVAAPVSDVTGRASAITAGIEDEGTRTLTFMLVAMTVLFLAGLAGAGYLNRRVLLQPLQQLAVATRAVASGDLTARVPIGRRDELGELGFGFNVMVDRLRESEQHLEKRVSDRTRELNTLLDVSKSTASTIELAPLLDVILDQLRSLVDYEGAAVVLLQGSDLVQVALRRPAFAPPPEARPLSLPLSASAPLWARLSRGEAALIDDIYGDSELAIAYRNTDEADLQDSRVAWIHAWAAIPLTVRDVTIGFLAFSHSTPGHFTEENVKLARSVADQAAIAIENARLFEETQQRAREFSALLEVARNVGSTLELQRLLRLILEQVQTVVPYDRSVIWIRDGDELTVAAALAAPGLEMVEGQVGTRGHLSDGGLMWQAIAQGDYVIIGDIRDDTPLAREYREKSAAVLELALQRVGSLMAVPIMLNDQTLGMMMFTQKEPRSYTDRHADLATAIGTQAGVAIANAQLFEQTQHQARDMEALSRADAELFRSLSLDQVLQALVDVAVDVLGADKSVVMLHEGDVDVIRASRNYSADNIAAFNRGLANMPHEEPSPEGRKPQVYADMSKAPDFFSKALSREGVKSHMFVPVRDAHRMLGVFGISFMNPHTFTEQEQQLYGALADRAAVAIHNAELYERAQQAASLEERQRLARELHDSVSQALYGIALGTRTARLRLGSDPHNAAEPIDYVMSLAEAGLAEMRALIFELRPESLELEGVVAAIEKQAASTRARYKLAVETNLGNEPDCALDVKEALYRIAQEALHNIVKHAQAEHVYVLLERDGGALVLTIRDDGRGFDPSASFPGHVGLRSMPERAAKQGGSVTIESAPGSGTQVVARIPI